MDMTRKCFIKVRSDLVKNANLWEKGSSYPKFEFFDFFPGLYITKGTKKGVIQLFYYVFNPT